jgi:uncharacterized protein
MVDRNKYIELVTTALGRSPVVAILGPRQCGKTTLATQVTRQIEASFFDLESQPDISRLQNPELTFRDTEGLIVIDEIQVMPELFSTLRVLVDREQKNGRFLILGSASPALLKSASESLAGRIEFIDLSGFNASEIGTDKFLDLWVRGGFPRSYLADTSADSAAWREGFVRTFLERDIPQLGITIPAPAMRRFWTMLAHYHGQTWNGNELARAMGLTAKTVSRYLDILTGTYMVRQLQPWHENLGKRQVKAPKIYLSDSGVLHSLLGLLDFNTLNAHPRLGASWEGFVINSVLEMVRPGAAYFWSTYQGAKIDLLFFKSGKRYGIEVKFSESPTLTKSLHVAMNDLRIDQAWVVHPGDVSFRLEERVTALAFADIEELFVALTEEKSG